MRSNHFTITASFLLACGLFLTSFANTLGDGFALIVNEANPVAPLTSSQAKLIYLRKINKRWKELSKNIVPVDNKSNAECRKSFLANVVGMSSDEMGRFFTEREYQNAEAPPVKTDSDASAIDYVENNSGAIAFVSKASIKPGQKVKIVLEF